MQAVVIDTDVASAILRRETSETLRTALQGKIVAVSFITAGELLRWTHVRHWGAPRRRLLDDWLREVLVLESTPATWRTWGRITAEARLRGRPRPVADSWIAACCLAWDLPLATANQRDFGLRCAQRAPAPPYLTTQHDGERVQGPGRLRRERHLRALGPSSATGLSPS